METKYLLPRQFKIIGWILFIPGLLLGIWWFFSGGASPEIWDQPTFAFFNDGFTEKQKYFSIIETNILDEIIGLLIIIGALLVAFSKLKNEDEFISKIRLESLVWATYINYGILILAILFVYNMSFFWVLMFNMFTILIFFIIRFHWALARMKNTLQDEE